MPISVLLARIVLVVFLVSVGFGPFTLIEVEKRGGIFDSGRMAGRSLWQKTGAWFWYLTKGSVATVVFTAVIFFIVAMTPFMVATLAEVTSAPVVSVNPEHLPDLAVRGQDGKDYTLKPYSGDLYRLVPSATPPHGSPLPETSRSRP